MQSLDQLKVDTPEQVALEFPLAGLGSRFMGLAIDTLIQFFTFFLVTIVLASSSGKIWESLARWFRWIPDTIAPALFILFIFCLYWGYFALFEILWDGKTPGKRLAGIRVIHQSGRPANSYEVIARNLLRAVDSLPGIYMVGVVTMILNRQNRRVGDFVAGTVVVHDHRMDEVQPDWNTREQSAVASPQLAALGPDDLVLIETFLHRRLDLDAVVRDNTAWQIANRISAKTGLQPKPEESWEHFLEGVARQLRDRARYR